MAKIIHVRLTDAQEEKIKQSGMTFSEYTRRAIDFYDEDIEAKLTLQFIDNCNEKLYEMKKNVMKTLDETHFHYKINEKKVHKKVQNQEKCTTKDYKNTENVISNHSALDENIEKKLIPYMSVIKNMLNNPRNMNILPDYYLKTLKKATGFSKETINSYVADNLEYLKNYEIIENE